MRNRILYELAVGFEAFEYDKSVALCQLGVWKAESPDKINVVALVNAVAPKVLFDVKSRQTCTDCRRVDNLHIFMDPTLYECQLSNVEFVPGLGQGVIVSWSQPRESDDILAEEERRDFVRKHALPAAKPKDVGRIGNKLLWFHVRPSPEMMRHFPFRVRPTPLPAQNVCLPMGCLSARGIACAPCGQHMRQAIAGMLQMLLHLQVREFTLSALRRKLHQWEEAMLTPQPPHDRFEVSFTREDTQMIDAESGEPLTLEQVVSQIEQPMGTTYELSIEFSANIELPEDWALLKKTWRNSNSLEIKLEQPLVFDGP